MQQRRYRPGDVLDDYCPRERRITDHAIVAMIDDDIKQTRCVVCDAEHEYKDGKMPAQRRRKSTSALFAQVLDGLQSPQLSARVSSPPPGPPSDDALAADAEVIQDAPPAEPVVTGTEAMAADVAPPVALAEPADEGPVRRQLIRAALPRPEGQPPTPTRAIPEFTIRQPRQRGRHARRRGTGGHQGFGDVHGPTRFGRGGGHGRPRRRGRGKKA